MTGFQRVAAVTDIPDPGRTVVEVDGEVVAIFHVDGRFYALDDVCTHDGGTLADGVLEGYKIACPRHGAKFDVRSGAALSMPAVRPTRGHAVRVEDGGVWVALGVPAAAPGPAPQSAPSSARTTPPAAAPAAGPVAGGPAAGPAARASAAAVATGGPEAAGEPGLPTEEAVREWLKEVKDPELFVNVIDLGLIYGVTLSPAADAPDLRHVAIDMTMTSPACPAGPQLIADTKRAVGGRPGVAAVEVRIVMDPPWSPDRMTDAGRDQLGIF